MIYLLRRINNRRCAVGFGVDSGSSKVVAKMFEIWGQLCQLSCLSVWLPNVFVISGALDKKFRKWECSGLRLRVIVHTNRERRIKCKCRALAFFFPSGLLQDYPHLPVQSKSVNCGSSRGCNWLHFPWKGLTSLLGYTTEFQMSNMIFAPGQIQSVLEEEHIPLFPVDKNKESSFPAYSDTSQTRIYWFILKVSVQFIVSGVAQLSGSVSFVVKISSHDRHKDLKLVLFPLPIHSPLT